MRLIQFYEGETLRLGAETENGVVDIAAQACLHGVCAPATMLELIRAGAVELEKVRRLVQAATCFVTPARWAPAVTGMEKMLCVGRNYAAHARELGNDLPTEPCIFSKMPNALAGHGDVIELPKGYSHFDYEAELVMIIGRTMKDVSAEEAADGIFGYTAGNDVSNREAQFANGQWLMGKSSDKFGPIGPCVVTADDFDPGCAGVQSRVNGVLRQDGNTRDLIFPVAEVAAFLSRHMTLRPGDVVFTGTPAGVITGMPKEKQVWLRAGDVVEITVSGIGTLRNTLA